MQCEIQLFFVREVEIVIKLKSLRERLRETATAQINPLRGY